MLKNSSFSIKVIMLAGLLGLSACNFATNDENIGLEDSSASGAVAAIIGGAILAGSPTAMGGTCPTVVTANGSGCTNVSGGIALSYNGCTFGGTSGTRMGTLTLLGTSLTCGSSLPSSVTQQYVGGGQTSTNEVSTGFDDLTLSPANLANFDTQTITPTVGSAYGVNVAGSTYTIARRVFTPSTDYSVTGSATNSSGTVTGNFTVYDNRLWVVGTATLSSLAYQSDCCFPVSGSITTTFAAGTHQTTPVAAGTLYVGNPETLTFNGCGSATYVDPTGASTDLKFTHCY